MKNIKYQKNIKNSFARNQNYRFNQKYFFLSFLTIAYSDIIILCLL